MTPMHFQKEKYNNIISHEYLIISFETHLHYHSTKLPPIIYLSKITARFKTLRRSHTFSSRKNERRKSRTCQTKVKPLCLQRKPIDSLRIFLATGTIRRTPLIAWKKWKSLFSSERDTIRTCRGSDHRSPATEPRVFRVHKRAHGQERKRGRGNVGQKSLEGGRRPRILVIGPGESRLGERRASDWLSHDPPEVPEAIQDPLLLRYNFHDTHG